MPRTLASCVEVSGAYKCLGADPVGTVQRRSAGTGGTAGATALPAAASAFVGAWQVIRCSIVSRHNAGSMFVVCCVVSWHVGYNILVMAY